MSYVEANQSTYLSHIALVEAKLNSIFTHSSRQFWGGRRRRQRKKHSLGLSRAHSSSYHTNQQSREKNMKILSRTSIARSHPPKACCHVCKLETFRDFSFQFFLLTLPFNTPHTTNINTPRTDDDEEWRRDKFSSFENEKIYSSLVLSITDDDPPQSGREKNEKKKKKKPAKNQLEMLLVENPFFSAPTLAHCKYCCCGR